MKNTAIIVSVVVCSFLLVSWNDVASLERDGCVALTNTTQLVDASFTNGLQTCVDSSTECEIRMDARLILSVCSYQHFLDNMDVDSLYLSKTCLSNNLMEACGSTNLWQHWTSRLLYAGIDSALDRHAESYQFLTNSIQQVQGVPSGCETNALNSALLNYFELSNVDTATAMQVFAGLSAAELGYTSEATNFAMRVPSPHKEAVLEFIGGK